MRYSVRTRLSIVISIVFLVVLIFLMTAGSVVIYIGLNEEKNRTLRLKTGRMIELYESEFTALSNVTDRERENLRSRFLEKLNADYAYTHDFVVFSLESEKSRRILSSGVVKNIPLLLPKGFLAKRNGFFNQYLANKNYRICISRHPWGTLVIGTENQTYLEIVRAFMKIFPVVGTLSLIFALLGGHFFAKMAMKPVAEAVREADQITLSNLKRRLPEYKGRDEFGALIITLNRMIARLEDGVKKIQQFTQDAAHELRTPLTIVRGELESHYQKDTLPNHIQLSIRRALDQTICMSKIVEDLMLLAQSDSGGYPIQKSNFRLDEVIKETFEDISILTENRPVDVILDNCDPIMFFGDEQLIRRLLLNISDNAFKYTQRGSITFFMQKQQEAVTITIKDTGVGISEEDCPYVFNRFFRAENIKTEIHPGSGLGLAISQWIVAAHSGDIRIESNLSQGTTVHMILPLLESVKIVS